MGLIAAIVGMRGLVRRLRTRTMRARHPQEPWRWVHHPGPVVGDDNAHGLNEVLVILAGWAAIVPLFYTVEFQSKSFGLVFRVVGAVGAVALVGRAAYLVLRRLRFGQSRLSVGEQPFFLGEKARVALLPDRRLSVLSQVKATLRCIQGREEVVESADDRTKQVVCYELWAQTLTVDAAPLRAGQPLWFEYELPASAEHSTTLLHENPPRYWELELSSAVPGIGYSATFLLPVYAASGG